MIDKADEIIKEWERMAKEIAEVIGYVSPGWKIGFIDDVEKYIAEIRKELSERKR